VLRDGERHVDAHQVERPEGGALRSADQLARQLVDLVGTDAELGGEAQGGEQPVDAEPVRDECRHVPGDDHSLAEQHRGERLEIGHGRRIGLCVRNQLEEAGIARRVEEVHPDEASSERVGAALGEARDGQPAGVRRDDGSLSAGEGSVDTPRLRFGSSRSMIA
jgi:hypothetical protein